MKTWTTSSAAQLIKDHLKEMETKIKDQKKYLAQDRDDLVNAEQENAEWRKILTFAKTYEIRELAKQSIADNKELIRDLKQGILEEEKRLKKSILVFGRARQNLLAKPTPARR